MSPAIWLILLAFIVVALETLAVFYEKRKRLWQILIFITAGLIAVFGVQAQRQQDTYNTELGKKSDKIAELTEEISRMSLGSDSFCYFAFLFAEDAPNAPVLALIHKGKYPLQGVSAVITDMELVKTMVPGIPKGRENARRGTAAEIDKLDELRKQIDVPFLGPPGTIVRFHPRWELPGRDQITYSIHISTQFEKFFQHLKLRKIPGGWAQAYRVHKHGPKDEIVVLLEEVPNNFPREQTGNVNWQYE